MDIPLLGFVAQVTLFAFPYCWLFRFLEKRIVGVRSDFWDAFLASFIALIGSVVINGLSMILLYELPWVLGDLIWAFVSVLLWFTVSRKLLKLERDHSMKISITMVLLLYIIDWILFLLGIELSIVV